MAALDQLRHPANLRLAWRWIRSNPDATYKSYFRPLYQHFAVAEDALLDDLSDRLRRGIYEPEPACKLFFPKPSGIFRPYSLLSVEDQIVYQAAANLIAEKLYPRVRQRYLQQVFGHLYAGKTSKWFYRKWSDGYKFFNKAARQAVDDGLIDTASFDLTACYDSMDHGVLCHFLKKLGFDLEFCDKLSEWLEKWTATEKGIFHHHGIPQGPLSSGLLSEVVLSHFDGLKMKGVNFRYFRYVDDIRLFAGSERDLRRLLVALDLMSKDVGLFPQSGKISIHKVTEIEDELKTISNPPEAAVKRHFVDQKKLLIRIKELTPRYRITDATRFKYLLAHANPSANLTARLWRIMANHPEVYQSVCNYLRRYPTLPRVAAQDIAKIIMGSDLYQSVGAEFVSAVNGRLPRSEDIAVGTYLRKYWIPRSMHPDSLVAIGGYLMRLGKLSPAQIAYACKAAPSWWTRAMLIELANHDVLSENILRHIVDAGVRDFGRTPALASGWKGFQLSYVPSGPRRNWNKVAELLLRDVGLIRRSTAAHCGIARSLAKLVPRIATLNWRQLFGARYSQAERQAVAIVAASGVNITNFVNLLDVFDDLLLEAIFLADGTIGSYTLGRIGSALNVRSHFPVKFPQVFSLVNEVHERRYESLASHPLTKRSGTPTKAIRFQFLTTAKRLLIAAVDELHSAGIA